MGLQPVHWQYLQPPGCSWVRRCFSGTWQRQAFLRELKAFMHSRQQPFFILKSPAGISKCWVGEGLLKMLSVSGDALVYTTLPSLSYHPVG